MSLIWTVMGTPSERKKSNVTRLGASVLLNSARAVVIDSVSRTPSATWGRANRVRSLFSGGGATVGREVRRSPVDRSVIAEKSNDARSRIEPKNSWIPSTSSNS